MVADAGVFLELAAAAVAQVELEAEVLRVGIGGGLHLDYEVVAVALGQRLLGDERTVLDLHRQCDLAGLRLGGDDDDLSAGGHWLELGVVEGDGDAVVLANEEFGAWGGVVEQLTALGTGDGLGNFDLGVVVFLAGLVVMSLKKKKISVSLSRPAVRRCAVRRPTASSRPMSSER